MSRLTLTIPLLFFLLFGFAGCKEELKKEEPAESKTTETTVVARTRSGYIKPEDKYEFPDISDMNDWGRPGIIKERILALQVPENVLANISTAGLLETCLEFPYNIDILFYDDYQKGFNSVVKNFNGFRELFKRPDLVNVLLDKYSQLTEDVKSVRLLQSIERGMFSFCTFVLEFMLAQDDVFENLNAEQERELFLLSLEHSKIKSDYPDVFGGWHYVSRALLYAKKTMRDNAAGGYAIELSDFIKAPLYLNLNTFNYLEDYIKSKFSIVES